MSTQVTSVQLGDNRQSLNYRLDSLRERAHAAKQRKRAYLDDMECNYLDRCRRRAEAGIQPLAICGMGRAGKDTAGEFLGAHSKLVYPGSCSQLMLPLVADMAELPEAQVFAERHAHRQFWLEACHALRGNDYAMLVRMSLAVGDMAVGIRGRLELEEVVRSSIVGMTLWVANDRVADDITVEYGRADCDLVIDNHGSVLDLYARLRKLIQFCRLA